MILVMILAVLLTIFLAALPLAVLLCIVVPWFGVGEELSFWQWYGVSWLIGAIASCFNRVRS